MASEPVWWARPGQGPDSQAQHGRVTGCQGILIHLPQVMQLLQACSKASRGSRRHGRRLLGHTT
jgi:hypothetical protein